MIIERTLRNKLQWNLIEIYFISSTKMHLKMSSGNLRPYCLGLNALPLWASTKSTMHPQNHMYIHSVRICVGLHLCTCRFYPYPSGFHQCQSSIFVEYRYMNYTEALTTKIQHSKIVFVKLRQGVCDVIFCVPFFLYVQHEVSFSPLYMLMQYSFHNEMNYKFADCVSKAAYLIMINVGLLNAVKIICLREVLNVYMIRIPHRKI